MLSCYGKPGLLHGKKNRRRVRESGFREAAVVEVVEAAGVEPASENVTGQETTCLFQFMPPGVYVIADAPPRTFAAHAQNGQETLAASLWS